MEPTFVPGNRGAKNLKDPNNFVYIKNGSKNNRTFWRCAKYRPPVNCQARAITSAGDDDDAGKLLSFSSNHSHEPDLKKMKIATAMSEMKKKAIENNTSPRSAFTEITNKLQADGETVEGKCHHCQTGNCLCLYLVCVFQCA